MAKVDERERRRQAFMARHQKSMQKNEGGGLGFFKQNLKGVNFWKCGKGDHDLDIIEYVAGPDDPDVKEGEITHVLEVYEHRDVGDIEGQSFICLEKTYQKPCPICEYRKQIAKNPETSEDVIKALRPNRYARTIYNVVVYDTKADEEKGVQVWHTSAYLFGQHIDKLAKGSLRRGEQELKMYSNPGEDGYSITFTREGTGFNTQFLAHQLVPRPDPIPQEYLDQAHQLDQLIYIPTYDEVYAAFWGEDVKNDQEEKPTRRQSTRETSARTQSRGRGASRVAKSDPEEPQATRGRGRSRKVQEEPQTDDYGPEDELPPSLQSRSDRNGELVCPGGGEFGVDAYEIEHCDNCDIWEECTQASQDIAIEEDVEGELSADPDEPQPLEDDEKPARSARGGRGRGRARVEASEDTGSNGRPARGRAGKPQGRTARSRRQAPVEDETQSTRSSRTARGTGRTARGTGRGRTRGIVR